MLLCPPQAVLPQTSALPSPLLISQHPQTSSCALALISVMGQPSPHLPSSTLRTELGLISLRPAHPIHRQTLAPLSCKPQLEPAISVPSAPSGFQAIKALASMPISSPGPAHTPSWLPRACRLSLDPPTWQLKPFSQSRTSLSISQARWVTSGGIPTLEPSPPSYKGPLPFPPSREL